jgi:hypothetical protein
MLLKSLGCLFAIALVAPVFAQTPSVPPSPNPLEQFKLEHSPMKLRGVRPDGSLESYNWAGYAVKGTSFTNASGSWKQPTVNCTKTPNSYAAFWVGLDGLSDTSVEQTGTLAICTGTTVKYYAWYEFYPVEDIELIPTVAVSPGNKISAAVNYSDSEFSLTITNETTGKTFTKIAKSPTAKRTSAEWIAEAPCCTSGGGYYPLSAFGTASYGEDYTDVNDTNYATDAKVAGPISDFGTSLEKITMVSKTTAKDEAVPAALSTDGSSFKIAWKSE